MKFLQQSTARVEVGRGGEIHLKLIVDFHGVLLCVFSRSFNGFDSQCSDRGAGTPFSCSNLAG